MNYRIITDGEYFKVQRRILFFFWHTPSYCVARGHLPLFAPITFKTELEAIKWAKIQYGKSGYRIRNYRKC